MAAHFHLASGPWQQGRDRRTLEFMHLEADDSLIAYFQSLASHVDAVDLDQLEPYGIEGERSWPPDNALVRAERIQTLYDALFGDASDRQQPSRLRRGGLLPWGALGDWEPPDDAGGREGVADFLFWLRRIFLEAARRDLYVVVLAD